MTKQKKVSTVQLKRDPDWPDIVEVEWTDTCMHNGIFTIKAANECDLIQLRDVGYLLSRGDGVVRISRTLRVEDKLVRDVLVIVEEAVLSINHLAVEGPREAD